MSGRGDDRISMYEPDGLDGQQERAWKKLTEALNVELRRNRANELKAEFFQKEGVKFDHGKRRVDLVPTEAINALAEVLTAGAVKYGEHNWRKGMDWSRVYSAAQRHMLAFWGGDDIDDESGMPHLWHALTNMAFLVSYQALSVGLDDRWNQEGDE